MRAAALASMRPRHYCRGRHYEILPEPADPVGFNEAAALLPRKATSVRLGDVRACAGFNEAAALLPRKA